MSNLVSSMFTGGAPGAPGAPTPEMPEVGATPQVGAGFDGILNK